MRTSVIGIGAIVAGAFGYVFPSLSAVRPSAEMPPSHRAPRLFKDSRQSLAIARAQGRKDITMVVATVAGRAAAAAADAQRFGGVIRHRDDEVGYLRVRVPLDSATRFAESPNVESAAADYDDSFPSRLTPAPGSSRGDTPGDLGLLQSAETPPQRPADRWPPRPGDYPLRNAYSAVKDIGAADMLARNPTYDGRGATIAILDGNFDLLLPELQTAYDASGAPVPKVADFLNVTDPRDDAEHTPQWVNMETAVEAPTDRVIHRGKSFRLPRPGRFRMGLFDERRFNEPGNAAYIDQDIDRNGNPPGDDGLFGVLWDERANDVWVDTDRDLDFSDEKAMTDYAKRPDVGVFGKDDPATPIRESIGFTVQTDAANKFISINVGIYQHATGIIGHVVGNRAANGRIAGVAPGARLVSVFYGVGVLHGAIEGMIRAFRHPMIDLIVFEQSVAMASIPYLLADGRHPISIIAQRLAERHHKLMFVPGSNAPGFGIVAEDGLAPYAVSVGGYQSRDSYLANWGAFVEDYDNLHWGALSHGPSGTGALKPDLIAPSGQISTDPGYRRGQSRRGLFELPPGYSVDGGTSTATPMAAGAAALVVSAAKQRGLRWDAPRLKAALQGSARYIPKLAAHEQGAGLVQVGAAIELLEKLQTAPSVTIVSRAPVRTALSHLLAVPNEGVGLYEREGWKAGDSGVRTITLVRTSGGREPMTFTLRWLGNDGTFGSASSVVLPFGKPTPVPVSIAVKEPGAHSAILLVEHPSIPIPANRVLATVVASLPLSASNGYTTSATVVVPKPSDRGVFVDVPAGTSALSFSATSSAGPTRLSLVSPDRNTLYPCSFAPTSGPCAVPNPVPGVWEINVANNEFFTFDETVTTAPKPNRVTVTATALGVSVTGSVPTGWLKADGAASFTLRLTARLGLVSSALVAPAAMGSAYRVSRAIAPGAQHAYEVVVPKGAGSLRARIAGVDSAADLDLYLLDCTSTPVPSPARPYDRTGGGKSPTRAAATCAPRAKAAGPAAHGEVEIADPAPGRWAVVVDGYAIPSGPVQYDYLDVFTHPRFGAVAVDDVADDRAAGAAWTVSAHAWAATLPEPPRVPLARVAVVSRKATQMLTGPDGTPRPVPVTVGAVDLFGRDGVMSRP